ncbi:MAG: SGNH/GDSL hydrolase family protein [Bacteroidota bacterium]
MFTINRSNPYFALVRATNQLLPGTMRFLSCCFLCFTLLLNVHAQPSDFGLEDGDRVVFIGDGLFENDLDHGAFEYALTTTWPNRRVTFRNLGWSGDTPAGISRDHFTNPPTPYEHLIEQIKSTNATVAFVGYGAHLAFESDAALDQFNTELASLLDTLDALPARVVLLTPAPQEAERSPAPSVDQYNAQLARVAAAIESVATARNYTFVDLFKALLPQADDPSVHISQNGIHLNALGYHLAGRALQAQLTGTPETPLLSVNLDDGGHTTAITGVQASKKEVSFTVALSTLPALNPATEGMQPLQITGLRRGRYSVWVNNNKAGSATAAELANAIPIATPLGKQATELQALIVKKNRTYFHQYRPQNETYLVGFREYEQGQNARELQLLDPLIGEVENEIGRLRIPQEVSIRVVAD